MRSLMSQASSSMTPPSLRRRKSLTDSRLNNRSSSANACLHVFSLDFLISYSISFAFQPSFYFPHLFILIVKLNRLHKREQIHPATSAGAR